MNTFPASARHPGSWPSHRVAQQHIFRIANGCIVEHWGVFDNLSILQQLGAVPTRG